MTETLLLKRLFHFALMLMSAALVYAPSTKAQSSEWKSAGKKDDIEIFYQVEKVGTDALEVTIRINNKRAKAITIIAAYVSYKNRANYGTRELAYQPCGLPIPSGGTRICEPIKINGKKITDVKIEWENADTRPKPKETPRIRPETQFVRRAT